MNNLRTIIEENKHEGKKDLGSYSVIACVHSSRYGGWEVRRIEARIMDNHYLLECANVVNNFKWESFGIVDIDKPEEVLNRMYEKAKEEAKYIAKLHENKILDLTSRVKKKPKEAKYYMK